MIIYEVHTCYSNAQCEDFDDVSYRTKSKDDAEAFNIQLKERLLKDQQAGKYELFFQDTYIEKADLSKLDCNFEEALNTASQSIVDNFTYRDE